MSSKLPDNLPKAERCRLVLWGGDVADAFGRKGVQLKVGELFFLVKLHGCGSDHGSVVGAKSEAGEVSFIAKFCSESGVGRDTTGDDDLVDLVSFGQWWTIRLKSKKMFALPNRSELRVQNHLADIAASIQESITTTKPWRCQSSPDRQKKLQPLAPKRCQDKKKSCQPWVLGKLSGYLTQTKEKMFLTPVKIDEGKA